jgi:hypothetical protein
MYTFIVVVVKKLILIRFIRKGYYNTYILNGYVMTLYRNLSFLMGTPLLQSQKIREITWVYVWMELN